MSLRSDVMAAVKRAARGYRIAVRQEPMSLHVRVYDGPRLIAEIERSEFQGVVMARDTLPHHSGRDIVRQAQQATMRAAIRDDLLIQVDPVGRSQQQMENMGAQRVDNRWIVDTRSSDSISAYLGKPRDGARKLTDATIEATLHAAREADAANAAISYLTNIRNNKILTMAGAAPPGATHSYLRTRLEPIVNAHWERITRLIGAARNRADADIVRVLRDTIAGRTIGMSASFGGPPAPTVAGLPVADVSKGSAAADVNRILSDIVQAHIHGQPLRNPTASMSVAERQAHAVARTSLQELATARQREASASLGVTHEIYVATLDTRTSMICASLDGKRYKIGEGPQPPIHYNCRSVRVSDFGTADVHRPSNPAGERYLMEQYTKKTGVKKVGGRWPSGHGKAFRKFRAEKRAELIGRVPSDITYGEWITRQPKDLVVSIMGEKRAEAFLSGKLSIEDMTNPATGREWSARQLTQMGLL